MEPDLRDRDLEPEEEEDLVKVVLAMNKTRIWNKIPLGV